MKSTILTAAALLGSATAELQKLKLQKVPLAEQLVRIALPKRRSRPLLTTNFSRAPSP